MAGCPVPVLMTSAKVIQNNLGPVGTDIHKQLAQVLLPTAFGMSQPSDLQYDNGERLSQPLS